MENTVTRFLEKKHTHTHSINEKINANKIVLTFVCLFVIVVVVVVILLTTTDKIRNSGSKKNKSNITGFFFYI